MAGEVELIVVPYDSALRDTRMGAGPRALLRMGLEERLQAEGHAVQVMEIEPDGEFRAEIATAFDLQRGVRRAVERAIAANRRPITLAGNCNTGVVGSLAAHANDEVGLFWFDAHSDAETPETTTSGFLDGTGLAMALGCCWRAMLDNVGEVRLDGARTALIGAREVSSAARSLLSGRGVTFVPPEQASNGSIRPAIDRLRAAGARRVHLHVDLDVLDSETVGPANSYALPGGLTEEELLRLLGEIAGEFDLASASVASYDPAVDQSGRIGAAGLEVIKLLAKS